MAVDGFYSAAVTSPKEEQTAAEKLRQLSARIARRLPNSPVVAYAIQQEIQADCVRGARRERRRQRQGPETPLHAPDAVRRAERRVRRGAEGRSEAARVRESLGETEEACRCYRFLSDHYSDKAVGRKCRGALWRLGQGDGLFRLQLPPLYPSRANETAFNLNELRASWCSSTSGRARAPTPRRTLTP